MPNQKKNPRHFKSTTFENSSRGKPQPIRQQQHHNHGSSANYVHNEDRSTNENLPKKAVNNVQENQQDATNSQKWECSVAENTPTEIHRGAEQRDGLICIICCHKTDLLCVGPCDHPVCFECSTRMRILCLSKECPICRAENEFVYVVHFRAEMQNYFANVIAENQQQQRRLFRNFLTHKYGICFETTEARDSVFDILAHVCTVCREELEFQSFEELARHMRRVHELFYCELCVEFLKLFSWERKCYTRHDLAQHKRIGDADDKSHKGHPLCKFCDSRFLDQDLLYKHLRKDHYFCHFCDVDGKNMFYTGIRQLKEHLKSAHFLCEIGQCRDEELGISFRHEIDFKAHKGSVHGRDMQKSDLKKELQVNVAFNFGPTPLRDRIQGEGGGGGSSGAYNRQRQHERSSPPINQQSLSGTAERRRLVPVPPTPVVDHGASLMAAAARPITTNSRNFSETNFLQLSSSEEFPSLNGLAAPEPSTSSSAARAAGGTMANVVDRVYFNPMAPRMSSSSGAPPPRGAPDFPALGRSAGRRTAAARRKEKPKTPVTGVEESADENRNVDEKRSVEKMAFIVIDDDEGRSNRSTKKVQNEGTRKDEKEPASTTTTTDAESSETANFWGKPKVAGMSQAEFPSLAPDRKSQKTAQKADPQWSKSLAVVKTKTEKMPKNDTISLKSIGIALEMESLPQTKAVVRKISFDQLERAENSRSLEKIDAREEGKQNSETANTLPPPGFAPLAPPPGFSNASNH